jgi:leader peptidase (prepilin peptidase)/N-methyltransferase
MLISFHWLEASCLGALGLLIGSFLNVVIYRVPVMLDAQWKAECAALRGEEAPPQEKFNLLVPRSRCIRCGHVIRWFENIPVLSYFFLRGKCAHCARPIGLRYPLVELSTGALFFYCGLTWGAHGAALIWSGFAATLLTLALIDWDTTLLPDDITLPLLWAGLIGAALQWTPVALEASLWGVVGGYLSLWLIYWGFKLITGKDGMGFGDFKLFAALGAWFGWQALIPMILLASVMGSLVGIAMKYSSGLREGGVIPFGPFLAGAGLSAMVWGPATLLNLVGM